MRAAVAPATDVHAPDLADGIDGALDADDERPELRCEVGREVAEVVVGAWLEEDDHGQAARLRER